MALQEARKAPGGRLGYVDTIKGLVVAGVIVAHAAMTYGLFGNWPYREPPLHPLPGSVALGFTALASLGLGLLFLIAGLFTPEALRKKATAPYVRDRLWRLGVPTVAYLALVIPLVNFLGRAANGTDAGAAAAYALHRLVLVDLGPMWFALALLLVTLGYVGWRAAGLPAAPAGPLRGRGLLAVALLAGAATFTVRVVQPVSDPAPVNLAAWPLDFALFALGALAARDGWLEALPAGVMRQAGLLVAAGLLVMAPLAGVAGGSMDVLLGGLHWQSALVSAGECLATIGLAIWLFRLFQRLGVAPLAWFTRSSFTAYLVQSPVVVLLALALRPVSLPPEAKTALLAALSLAACFGLAGAYREWRRGRRAARPRHPALTPA